MADSDKDHGRSRRPDAKDRGWSSTGRILDGRTIERLGAAVCCLHYAGGDKEHEFLDSASKPRSMVYPQNHWDGLPMVWPQNHWDDFLWFDLKTGGDDFLRFGLKTGGDGFSRFGFKTGGGFLG
jgi:hypothetical protein